MTYARLLSESTYDERLARRQKELRELKTYPSSERALTGVSKIFMALLIGGSNVVTLVLVHTMLSTPVSIGFLAGAIVYAIKAARDVYKKRRREKELTNQLQLNLIKLEILFNQDFLDQLHSLLSHSAQGFLNLDQSERLYMYLHELKDVFDVALPDPKQNNRYVAAINEGIRELTPRLRVLRGLANGDTCAPDWGRHAITFLEEEKTKESFSVARYSKKAGNRLLSFMAGASSAIGIGLGIASLALGMTLPTGWVMFAILASSAVIGVMSVVIDYHLTRREDNKVQKLEYKNRDLIVLQDGVNTVKTAFKTMEENVMQTRDHTRKEIESESERKALREENELLNRTNQALETSLANQRQEMKELRSEVREVKGREVMYLPAGTTVGDMRLFRPIKSRTARRKGKQPAAAGESSHPERSEGPSSR